MSKRTLSLRSKVSLATLPLIFGITFFGYNLYRISHDDDVRDDNALKAIELSDEAELQMVKMSEALRGYMISPSKTVEMENKKAADAAYSDASKKLSALITDSPEAAQLNKEMAEFDEAKLDKAENELMEMITKRDRNAFVYFEKTYEPYRIEQAERFLKLKDLVNKRSRAVLASIESEKRQSGTNSLGILALTVIFGLGVISWIMSTSMKKIIGHVEGLNRSNVSLGGTCVKLSGASEVLYDSVKEQASAIQESVSALSEMGSMIQQTSKNAKLSLQVSCQVEERSQAGQEIMRKMSSAMIAIEKTNESLQDIAQVIHAINVKTGVINDIVFKTQMLSFNAAIEAARAGQNGRGFAVVAEEMGKLAQMSGSSAGEIEALLSDSQKQVHSTLEMIKQRVSEGKVVSDDSVKAFNEISVSIKEVTSQIKSITEATTQQSVGIEQSEKALRQLDVMSRKNSETAGITLDTSKALKRIASELNSTSQGVQFVVLGKHQEMGTSGSTTEHEEVVQVAPFGTREETFDANDESFKKAA